MSESFYAVRRTDRELIRGEYSWIAADGPEDWTSAEDDSEYHDGPIEYELVLMHVESIAKKSFPEMVDCPDHNDIEGPHHSPECCYFDSEVLS